QGLLADDEPRRARFLFERHLVHTPDSADGWAGLAACLLALGEVDRAHGAVVRAVTLAPDNPNHCWNLSAVAHAQGRLGGCYLALLDYTEQTVDGFDGAVGDVRERVALARRFIAEYERIARLEHPGHEAEEVAAVDELVFRGAALLDGGEPGRALTLLESAVAALPVHCPALTALGRVFIATGQPDRAEGILHRALVARPGDPAALAALALVERGAGAAAVGRCDRRGG
ncbi:MAG: tetratricopeptide repeat protein, partial [Myxococcota bacterium]